MSLFPVNEKEGSQKGGGSRERLGEREKEREKVRERDDREKGREGGGKKSQDKTRLEKRKLNFQILGSEHPKNKNPLSTFYFPLPCGKNKISSQTLNKTTHAANMEEVAR